MNIVISGYTAAGKTTHTRLLAQALGYDLVWAAGLLLERLGFDLDREDESQLWFHRYADIGEMRDGTDVDARIDAIMVSRVRDGDQTVFDARYLPWAAESAPLLRVWLGSDQPSRARKCHVSLGDGAPSVLECAAHMDAKDAYDVARIAECFGAVFGPNEDVFDVVLDNSCFIPHATAACAKRGIADFSRYLLAAVRAADGQVTQLAELRSANEEEFRRVVRFVRGVPLH